jgi:hypothetical protein
MDDCAGAVNTAAGGADTRVRSSSTARAISTESVNTCACCCLSGAVLCSETAKSFKGKQIDKGVAFPTCVSPNRCAACVWDRQAGRLHGSSAPGWATAGQHPAEPAVVTQYASAVRAASSVLLQVVDREEGLTEMSRPANLHSTATVWQCALRQRALCHPRSSSGVATGDAAVLTHPCVCLPPLLALDCCPSSIVGHFSPVASEPITLNNGDLVKM